MRRLLILVVGLAALSGCGGCGANADSAPQDVAPLLEPERLPPGPLPGKQVDGTFRIPGVGAVRDVRQLSVAGRGAKRTALLITRGERGELCVAVAVAVRVRRASFKCLERWDRPPLIVRVGVGGRSRNKTNWLSVVGLVRREVRRVVVESEQFDISAARIQAWPGFPWKSFGLSRTDPGNLPIAVYARDASGAVAQEVELNWAHRAPCEAAANRCKGPNEKAGNWSAARDPIAEAMPFTDSAVAERSKRLATDHPTVRRLVAGQAFSIGPIPEWHKCNRDLIGAGVPIRLAKPISFEGDVPVVAFDGGGSNMAYREGIAHMRIEGAASFRISVDLNRGRVVGIGLDPEPDDPRTGKGLKPKVELKIVQELRPAGGPDANCGRRGD